MSGLRITSTSAGTLASARRFKTSRFIRQTRSRQRCGVCRGQDFFLPQGCWFAPRAGFSTSTSCDERAGAMRIITQLAETIAVLIPDFQMWGLSTYVFFSLYCYSTTVGLSPTKSTDSGLLLSLFLGYVAALALNIVSFLSSPPVQRVAASSRLTSTVEPPAGKSPRPQWSPNMVGAHKLRSRSAGSLARQPHYVGRVKESTATPDSDPRYSS